MNLKSKTALATLSLMASLAAFAEDKPPETTLAYNVGVVSEYRYRGISQTALAPALQGGVDYNHKSGLYIGTWASQIRWIAEAGTAGNVETKGPVEQDIYGGYKGEIAKDFTYDVGYLRYQYWGNNYTNIAGTVNPNTDEVYGALTYGAFTGKLSYAFSNLFGTDNSKGSTYTEVAYTFDLGNGLSLVPHVGHQEITGTANKDFTYNDFALTLGKDYGNGFSVSAAAIGTDGKTVLYTTNGRKTADATLVLGAKYTF
jgi:uncharacterized protein (TIGR02001 family)